MKKPTKSEREDAKNSFVSEMSKVNNMDSSQLREAIKNASGLTPDPAASDGEIRQFLLNHWLTVYCWM